MIFRPSPRRPAFLCKSSAHRRLIGELSEVFMRCGVSVLTVVVAGTLLMGASMRPGMCRSDPIADGKEAMARLTTAACNDDVAAVREILNRLPRDAALRREGSAKALHIAATLGQVRLVRAMLEEGVAVDAKSPSGCTPLMMAAGEPNSVEIARLLLASGADVNAADSRGATPLMCAAMAGDVPLVQLLLKRGAAYYTRELWIDIMLLNASLACTEM
jgi:hypothetical protein